MPDVLLLEPDYKNKYPPLGLMKISTYHKNKGDNVVFAKGQLTDDNENKKWDRIYITTLFTFEWKKTKETIEYAKTLIDNNKKIFIGGIAATIMCDKIEEETGIKPIKRKLDKDNGYAKSRIGYDDDNIIDNCTPDYKILNDIEYEYPYNDAYFAYMTRGCGMNCEFCAVQTLEPEYIPYIPIKKQIEKINKEHGRKKNLLLMDNNVLRSPKFNDIVEEIKKLGFDKGAIYKYENEKGELVSQKRYVDFNQGLDANLLTEEKAKKLSELAIRPARIAFDHIEDRGKYERAIKRCAKYGIKYFSNYMLYNADDFQGKGSQYKADAPEDLYKRLQITMELQDSINEDKKEDEKIKIYSFPMKYIPLEDTDRSYIGPKWNAKFLRAIQVMLLPCSGVGGVSEEFFRKAFGEDIEEYKKNLRMPESILMSRGKFLKRDDESEKDRNNRLNNDKEASLKYEYYKEWNELYENIDNKDDFLKVIKGNRFKAQHYLKIEEEEIKKIFLHYLSKSQFLILLNRLVKEGLKEEINLIYKYVTDEFEFYIQRIAKYIHDKRMPYKKIRGYIKVFEKFGVKLILKYWVDNNLENQYLLDRLEKTLMYIGQDFINIDKLHAIKCYIDSDCLNKEELSLAKTYIRDLNEEGITRILRTYFHDFKKQLKFKNKDEPGFEKIEKKIEIMTAKLGEQLSLF